MALTALVSITGPDRVGLISAVSSRLFDLGANLGDSAFSVLNGHAEFTAVCEFTMDMDLITLQQELAVLPSLANADIQVTLHDVSPIHLESETISHIITVSGGDTPGLTARLCEVFEQFGANIIRLKSDRVAGSVDSQYILTVAVSIPKNNVQSCLATITNTAGELGLEYDHTEVHR